MGKFPLIAQRPLITLEAVLETPRNPNAVPRSRFPHTLHLASALFQRLTLRASHQNPAQTSRERSDCGGPRTPTMQRAWVL